MNQICVITNMRERMFARSADMQYNWYAITDNSEIVFVRTSHKWVFYVMYSYLFTIKSIEEFNIVQ